VAGFVWKSHERHTADLCAELPPGPPRAIGSAILNRWAGVEDVLAAVGSGAGWVWCPTCDAEGMNAWNLPLPVWWNELWAELVEHGRRLVLATGHLDSDGRRIVAEACAGVPHITCSITHSHFVSEEELVSLSRTGCAFEFDCYTLTHTIPGLSAGSLRRFAELALERGCNAYLTSDGGQASTGNPFAFAAATLRSWRPTCGDDLLVTLSRSGPERLVDEALD